MKEEMLVGFCSGHVAGADPEHIRPTVLKIQLRFRFPVPLTFKNVTF
jgi:hypothetical protein